MIKGPLNLLLSSHPLATRLLRTTSAWDLVMFDLSEPTSRRAASEDTEYASCGASMICSTCDGSVRRGGYRVLGGSRTTALK